MTGVAAPSITDNTVWSSSDAVLTFDAASDTTWKDKAYASNDSDTYADMARIEGATVGEKAKLTATVSLDGDISGLDGAEASDGSYNAIQLACAIYHLHLMYQRWEMYRRSYSSTIPTQHMLARSQ